MFGLGRKALAAAFLVMAGILALSPVTVRAADPFGDPYQIPVPPLHEIQVPHPDRFVLDNGMVVYLLEDHDFPLVDARALIRVGAIYDPPDRVGLATLTGEVMRTGGSTTIDGDALDEKLESMGASISIGIGDTDGSATVSTLSQDIEEGMRILSDLLRHPAFPQEKIDLAKKEARAAIASRNDEAFSIVARELRKLIYGKDHPYARTMEYATVDAITRDDMVAFHDKYFYPDRIILTVYGDFNSRKMKKLLKRVFGDWARSTEPLPPDPEVTPTKVTGIFVADKEGMTNSMVMVGHEGMRMDDPDYAAMRVFGEVMGGGFASRIVNEIRTKRGLAYASGASIGAGMHHPGALLFYVVTQTDSTTVTLGYLDKEIEKALAEPFTEEELQLAKDSILNSLVFSFSSKFSVLNRLAAYEFYGYPADFLQRYQEAVKNVTAQQVLEAARRHVRYPAMATLIVGEEKNFKDALAALGPYTELDISIPEPKGSEVPEATPESLAQGRKILAAAAKAMGADALASLQDMTVEQKGTFTLQGMELQISARTVRKFPDCEWNEQKLPMGTMVQAVCGDQGWMDAMQGPQPMPPDALARMKEERVRDLVQILRNYGSLQAQALPDEILDGKPVHVLFVHNDAVKDWKIYVDADTNYIVRMQYRSRSPMSGGPVTEQMNYSDYRRTNGFAWPYERTVLQDGKPLATMTTVSVNGPE